MKLLTGKAKECFLKHIQEQSNYTNYSNSLIKYENSERGEFIWFGNQTNLLNEDKFLNALIIDWFDSLGICIEIRIEPDNKTNTCIDDCEQCEDCYDYWIPKYEYSVFFFSELIDNVNDYDYKCGEFSFDTRQQATEEAIKKANEIFNNR